MKKNKCILILLLTFLCLLVLPVGIDAEEEWELHNFTMDVSKTIGGSTTQLAMTWSTYVELDSLEIVVVLADGAKEYPFNWSRLDGTKNTNCTWVHTEVLDVETNEYDYFLEFDVESGRVGNFYLKLYYAFADSPVTKENIVYVATGNQYVKKEVFTKNAAMFVGVVASCTSIIATYFILNASTNNESEEEKDYE